MVTFTLGASSSIQPAAPQPADLGGDATRSGLDALLADPSQLDRLLQAPSLTVAQAGGQNDFVSIRRQAPVEGILGTNNRATIEIQVRPLSGEALGTLNTSQADINRQLTTVSATINRENEAAYGTGTAGLRDQAVDAGYFRSPAHLAWADAAAARTGGRIPADWWVQNDPFGGTAGNGPNVLPGGTYPGAVSRIAMGHDTDWTLGRHFDAGPMRALHGSTASPADQGSFGLVPNHSIDRGFGNPYASPGGHPDWRVDYWRTGS